MAAHEKTHSKKLGEAVVKQKRKATKNEDKPKRTYKKRKSAGEKTKRIKKEPKEKNKRQKKVKNSFTKLDISSLTPDMITQMNDYLHQELKIKQEKEKANNECISNPVSYTHLTLPTILLV